MDSRRTSARTWLTVLQNWKSVKLKCGVLGHCVTILVHQYHASTSEIEIISIGIHDLAASQHQFLDDTKHFVTSKNWCWLAAKSWIPIDMISISLVEAWYWCTKSGKQHPNTPHFSWTLFQFWSTVLEWLCWLDFIFLMIFQRHFWAVSPIQS